MKLLTVIGARPQFIKAATVSRVVAAREDITEVIVHTGQHYDAQIETAQGLRKLDEKGDILRLAIGERCHA